MVVEADPCSWVVHAGDCRQFSHSSSSVYSSLPLLAFGLLHPGWRSGTRSRATSRKQAAHRGGEKHSQVNPRITERPFIGGPVRLPAQTRAGRVSAAVEMTAKPCLGPPG